MSTHSSSSESPIHKLRPGSHASLDWPVLRVVGPDAASWLNGIITCDALSVAHGKAAWGSLLSKQGKIQADLIIVGRSDELFVVLAGGEAEAAFDTLDGYLVMEDAEIERTPNVPMLAFGEEARGRLKEETFAGELTWGELNVVVGVLPAAERESLSSAFSEVSLSSEGLSSLRTYLGIPQFGIDYDATDNPHAASLERRTVNWQKGCYLGQEVVCMQDMRGKTKKRLVFLMSEDEVPGATEVKNVEGEAVGDIRSRSGDRAVASVRAPHYEPGTKLVVGDKPVVVASLA